MMNQHAAAATTSTSAVSSLKTRSGPSSPLITTAHRSPRAQRSNTWHNKHILAVGKPTTLTSQRYATTRRSKNYTGAGLTAGTKRGAGTAVTAWDRWITLM